MSKRFGSLEDFLLSYDAPSLPGRAVSSLEHIPKKKADSTSNKTTFRDLSLMNLTHLQEEPDTYHVYKPQPKNIAKLIETNSKFANNRNKLPKPRSISADYSYVTSKVNCFRKKEEYQSKVPQKIQLQEKVRNELL